VKLPDQFLKWLRNLLCAQAVKRNLQKFKRSDEERPNGRSHRLAGGTAPDAMRTPDLMVDISTFPVTSATAFATTKSTTFR